MRQVDVKEMKRILKKNGYSQVRTNGSHSIWKRDGDTISVPVVTFKSVIANRLIKSHNLAM